MSSSSDPSKTVMERKKKGAPIKFLVPLIYAPALPLIRLSLRHQPVLRDRLFGLVLAGAFAHGFYLVYHSSWFAVIMLMVHVGVNCTYERISMMQRANEKLGVAAIQQELNIS